MITLRHAWLQKHPSPVAASGEFHWFPREGDRELRSELVERVRGLEPPAVLWELAQGRIVWARSFAATAPVDGRRYVGLAVTVAEGLADPCELLCALDVPPAAPWTSDAPSDLDRAAVSELPGPAELAAHAHGDLTAIARGLLSSGPHRIADPNLPELALLVAAIERQLPETLTPKQRRGAWVAGDGAREVPRDRVAELLAAAARTPTSDEARAWRLLCDLAESRREGPDAVAAAATADPLTVEEHTALARGPLAVDAWGAPQSIARVETPVATELVAQLHAWGRGRFDLCPTAGSLLDRLADAVALRVLGELERGGDPRRPIAEARWYSLLPAQRRDSLLDTLTRRAGSLRSLVETTHA